MVGASWVADTTEIEGVVSLIKCAVAKRSTRISLPLLDAIVALSKESGLGSRASNHVQYSRVSAVVDEMVSDSADHLEVGKKFMEITDRYADPTYMPALTAVYNDSHAKFHRLGPAKLEWASSHALLLSRHLKASAAL